MPNKYTRKTNRATKTSHDVMKRAAQAVTGGQSLRSAAKDFAIDKMTLRRFIIKQAKCPGSVTGYAAITNAHVVFTPEMEKDLADHVKRLADMFHGLSIAKCCQLAYSFAAKNKVTMPKNWEANQKAGKAWWHGFKARHNLAVRSPEATSLGRATAFNRHTVGEFYDNLAEVIDKYQFTPDDIHNTDESGCTTVQKPKDVVTERGKKQVGSITSAERGELVTIVYTINAAGNVLPPMFIFPRKNYRDHFIRGGPVGSVGCAAQSGWINEELFCQYLKHVIRHTRCTVDRKILLILDNHESHISLQAIEMARANGVVMLTIPPHTSHRLQPLDRTVFGPFKTAYNMAMDAWLRSNPGKTVTIYDIPELVKQAQHSAMTPRNIVSGFESTGICPYNRELFTEIDFAPANVTDRALPETAEVEYRPLPQDDFANQPVPGPSTYTPSSIVSQGMHTYVSPSDIHALPKADERKKTRTRRRGKTTILTNTPIRDQIALLKKKPAPNVKKTLIKVNRKTKASD